MTYTNYLSIYLIHSLLIFFSIVFISGCILNEEAENKHSDKPNIVIIFVDDMGYGDVGMYVEVIGLGSGGFTSPAHVDPGPDDPQAQQYNLEVDMAETNNLWHDYPEKWIGCNNC